MKLVLVCGHYGCGKTNLSIHLASELAQNYRTALVDLDVVNPYFRSSDYTALPSLERVTVISPTAAGSTIDAPYLRPEVFSVFDAGYEAAVFDVGGDDAGAIALGQYAARIAQQGYEMLYVINQYRPLVAQPAEAVAILREIETASRLKATGLINNSHLGALTNPQHIRESLPYAQEVSRLSGLTLVGTTAPVQLASELTDVDPLIPVEIVVRPPWGD